jgi:membrane-associated phospholipid phosphatase
VTRYSSPLRLVCAAGLGLFAALAVAQQLQVVGWFDRPLLEWLRDQRQPTLTRVVLGVTALGDGWILAACTCAAAAWLWTRRRVLASYLLCAGAGVALLSPLLKVVFQRPRPELALRLTQVGDYSFPSGHSLGSAAVYGALAIVLGLLFPRWRFVLLLCWVVLVGAIGGSRAYLHVHYPSDVLAGWALGGVWSVLLGRRMLRSAPRGTSDT